MPLDVPDGADCFIYANIFYYHFVETPPFSQASTTFLNRVVVGAITGYSSVHVLAEAILALRAMWKSQDARWERPRANRPAYILAKIEKSLRNQSRTRLGLKRPLTLDFRLN